MGLSVSAFSPHDARIRGASGCNETMGRIQQLPTALANKIAAGEVIERPASVVKELVENAVDAGARRIVIELEDAGKQLIRVSDDGCGMDADDLALAFREHATSKLRTTDDLFYIDTMGFRGEALPSIGSISHARIVSRAQGAPHAFEIRNDGGELTEVMPASNAQGTTVEIKNLFFNTPVRRKFLRQNSTEVSRVVETVQRIALPWHDVGFTLRNDGRTILELAGTTSRRERILDFSGSKLSEHLVEVNDFDEYASLTGFVGTVNEHRPNSRELSLFVNKRFVRDRSLLHAITLAYKEFIPHGRYPVAFLFLEIDPSEVDVNVHPTKIEVRFTQANRLFSKIKAAVQEAVLRSGQLPRIQLNDQRIEQLKAIGAMSSQQRIHAAMSDFMTRARAESARAAPMILARPEGSLEPDLLPDSDDAIAPENSESLPPAIAAADRTSAPMLIDADELVLAREVAKPKLVRASDNQALRPLADDAESTSAQASGDARQPSLLNSARGLFQIGDMFIIVETGDGLILIDQHAYHERVLYWKLEHRLQAEPPEIQKLLVPEPLELSRRTADMVGDYRELFRQFGFIIEPFGSGGWACYGLPRYVKTSKVNEFVVSCLEELSHTGRPGDPASLRKAMVDMMACKAAIKAGESLTMDEMTALLAEGAKVPHTFACPHGRPTTFLLTFTDLEKFFHRR